MSNPYPGLKSDISQTYGILQPHSSLRTNSTMCCEALVHPSHQEVKSCNILNWAECQPIRTISIRSGAKTRFAHSSGIWKWNPARPSVEQNFNQSETISTRSWTKIRFAYHFGTWKWNPARSQIKQILQQITNLPTRSIATAWSLKSSILQQQENLIETLCQYYWSKYILKFDRIKWKFTFRI